MGWWKKFQWVGGLPFLGLALLFLQEDHHGHDHAHAHENEDEHHAGRASMSDSRNTFTGPFEVETPDGAEGW